MENKKNVLVVFGGRSFEHDISIITALIILKKSKGCKYNLLPVYLTRDDEWFYFAKDNLTADCFKNFNANYKSFGFKKAYFKSGEKALFYKNTILDKKIDVYSVLNCCHGGNGENGELVAFFNQLGIPVSVGDSTALGICMDKIRSKYFFKGLNLPTIDFFTFTKDEFIKQKKTLCEKADKFGYPLILKPATLGSSIGVEIVKNETEFLKASETAISFDNNILVEKAILNNMSEYNIAVMRHKTEILLTKIDKPMRKDEILSFNDKYIGDSSKNTTLKNKSLSSINNSNNIKGGKYLTEKKFEFVPDKISKQIKQISSIVYKELQLSGIVRIDFIVNKKGKVFINEINTVPGSLAYYFFVPSIFKTMASLIEILIEDAVHEFDLKSKIKKEFITNILNKT